MSSGGLRVRLQDGTVLYGVYSGTVDVAMSALFDTDAEAWEAFEANLGYDPERRCDQCQVESAQIFALYGGDWWWEGDVCTQCHMLSNHASCPWGCPCGGWSEVEHDCYGAALHHDGQPEWVAATV